MKSSILIYLNDTNLILKNSKYAKKAYFINNIRNDTGLYKAT